VLLEGWRVLVVESCDAGVIMPASARVRGVKGGSLAEPLRVPVALQ
jgi:hypothetical protein